MTPSNFRNTFHRSVQFTCHFSNHETVITQLHTACEEGQYDKALYLIQQGYDVNATDRFFLKTLFIRSKIF